MGGPIDNAATFLVETLFSIYILIVMLRLLLQWARADFYNPLSQFIVKATQPVLAPMHRTLPSVAGVDLACVVLLVVLQFAELWLITGLLGHRARAARPARALRRGNSSSSPIYVFLFSILIQVIMSWINPGSYNPLLSVLHSLNEPLLGPARRIVPPIGGLDLSPIVVMVALQLVAILRRGTAAADRGDVGLKRRGKLACGGHHAGGRPSGPSRAQVPVRRAGSTMQDGG